MVAVDVGEAGAVADGDEAGASRDPADACRET
jgi:hypothetical protein